jgi:hypothetical protein
VSKKKAKKKTSKKKEAPVRKPPEAPADTEGQGTELAEAIGEGMDPAILDPELVKRAQSYGFTEQQIKGYTTNGALQAACDRCKPPLVVTGREGKPEPKARQQAPNQVPKGCKDYPLEIQAITERSRIATRNRLAFDHGVAQACVRSFVRAHRQEGQVFCKRIQYDQSNEARKDGSLVTDIKILMAV